MAPRSLSAPARRPIAQLSVRPGPVTRSIARMTAWRVLLSVLLVGDASLGIAQAIPVRPGVTLVYATKPVDSDLRPDFERLVTIDTVRGDDLVLEDYAGYALKPGGDVVSKTHRTLSRRESEFSRALWMGGTLTDTSQHRGTSYMMISTAVSRGLRADGETSLRVGLSGELEESGTLRRLDAVKLPVLINGRVDSIPTVHAHLDQVDVIARGDPDYEFWFADDTTYGWLVQVRVTQNDRVGTQQLVRVEWSDSTTMSAFAQTLRTTCRARVSGVFFASGSATIAPASDATLGALANTLRRALDWQVTIEGHTDSIGGSAYNQDLSERRSRAVKQALVSRFGIAPARLVTTGFGLSRPIASNATLSGRARNRRVELTRPCTEGKS